MSERVLEQRLFALAVALTTIPLAFGLATDRHPYLHDTMELLLVDWVFLNGTVTAGEVPQWFPHYVHGDTSFYSFQLTTGLAQSLYLLLAHLWLPNAYLLLFEVGMWVEELVLLVGTWLLARRFLSPFGTLLATLSLVLPTVWYTQAFWVLRLAYLVPLQLHCLHSFLETGRARWGMATVSLFVMQHWGCVLYAWPVSALFLAAYAVGHAALGGGLEQLRARPLRTWATGVGLAGVLFGAEAAVLHATYTYTLGSTDYVSPLRNADATVGLDVFLHFPNEPRPAQWLEAVTGYSGSLDLSMYSGFLVVPLLVIGAGTMWRKAPAVLVALGVTLAFAHSDLFATATWYVWPTMAYFRRRGWIFVLARLCLALMAGAGLDALIRRDATAKAWRVDREAAVLLAALCLMGAAVLALLPHLPFRAVDPQTLSGPGLMHLERTPQAAIALLRGGALVALLEAAVAAGLASGSVRAPFAAALLLSAHGANVLGYRLLEQVGRTRPYSEGERASFDWTPLPPPTVRRVTTFDDPMEVERLDALGETLAHNETTSEFAFLLQTGTARRVDRLQKGVAELFDVAGWDANADTWQRELPAGSDGRFHEIAGTTGMLQVHRGRPSEAMRSGVPVPTEATRIGVPVDVLEFSANRLTVRVQDAPAGAWLRWADAWNPDWTASIDGVEAAIEKTDLAYKAVALPEGDATVRFRFDTGWFEALSAFLALHSLAVLAGVGALAGGILTSRRSDPRSAPSATP